MNCRADSTASSFDRNSKTANPPTTSFASANGPSITPTFPFVKRTWVLIDRGASPPVRIIRPAFTSASASRAITSISGLGGGPGFSTADLTNIMNFMGSSPGHVRFRGSGSRASESRLNSHRWLQAELRHGVVRAERLLGRTDRADFNFGISERGTLNPLDRLLQRLHLPQPEPADQFLRLGERTVDDRLPPAGEADPRPLRARLEGVHRQEDTRFH